MKIAQIDKHNQLAIVPLDHNALVGEWERTIDLNLKWPFHKA